MAGTTAGTARIAATVKIAVTITDKIAVAIMGTTIKEEEVLEEDTMEQNSINNKGEDHYHISNLRVPIRHPLLLEEADHLVLRGFPRSCMSAVEGSF
jgi:hypothetical protein